MSTDDNKEGKRENHGKVGIDVLAKAYEIDVFKCPKCGSRMSVIAVICNPESIREIITCLEGQGHLPPSAVITRVIDLAYAAARLEGVCLHQQTAGGRMMV